MSPAEELAVLKLEHETTVAELETARRLAQETVRQVSPIDGCLDLWLRLKAAATLIGTGRIDVSIESEDSAAELVRLSGGSSGKQTVIYPPIGTMGHHAQTLFFCKAMVDAVEIEFRGSRPATEAELAEASVYRQATTTTAAERDDAIRRLEVA